MNSERPFRQKISTKNNFIRIYKVHTRVFLKIFIQESNDFFLHQIKVRFYVNRQSKIEYNVDTFLIFGNKTLFQPSISRHYCCSSANRWNESTWYYSILLVDNRRAWTSNNLFHSILLVDNRRAWTSNNLFLIMEKILSVTWQRF